MVTAQHCNRRVPFNMLQCVSEATLHRGLSRSRIGKYNPFEVSNIISRNALPRSDASIPNHIRPARPSSIPGARRTSSFFSILRIAPIIRWVFTRSTAACCCSGGSVASPRTACCRSRGCCGDPGCGNGGHHGSWSWSYGTRASR